jgi:bacillaene synthase trans-acting acyltransferase
MSFEAPAQHDRSFRYIQTFGRAEQPVSASNATPKILFMFSGQGPQTYHMAADLYRNHSAFRLWMDSLDLMFAPRLGGSVLEHMYDPSRVKSDPFDNILYSHPAIFMVEMALSQALIDCYGPPDCVLGASLGEFAAAAVAGAISLEDAVVCVADHAKRLSRKPSTGGMLAVIADRATYYVHPEIWERCEIATLLPNTHFVVAGTLGEIAEVEAFLEDQGIESVRLPVAHAFHSSRIDCLRADLRDCDLDIGFREPNLPVISCTYWSVVEHYWPGYMWEVMRRPLQIDRTLSFSRSLGPMVYVDLGPGATLANAVGAQGRRATASTVLRVLSPFGDELGNMSRTEARLGELRAGRPA